MMFGHHQKDQEGQECPRNVVFEDFCCLDGYFISVPPYIIPFWNPWDIVSILEGCTVFLVIITKIRKVKNVQHMGYWRILSFCPHIHNIFWNPNLQFKRSKSLNFSLNFNYLMWPKATSPPQELE